MKNLVLYSTTHCHLCEKAESILVRLATDYKLHWECIEIADDAQLLNLYELKIPVLKRLDTQVELNWPYNIDDVKIFLNDLI